MRSWTSFYQSAYHSTLLNLIECKSCIGEIALNLILLLTGWLLFKT
ncbi:hypothetical protein C1752_06334 [Acaryochloris thomasi RCC1774]|uniref:Uncharacterized protein n=1 Tax=Acaryochloris thomasi RCC1774 TaxID=1764569 RepID=A0A2W1JJ08_9CYAN|nr:hypothetical protein C1752_06334 [Acaryochloris thomasi RCC1774]